MQPVPVQRSRMRRALGRSEGEEERRREARWVVMFSVSGLHRKSLSQSLAPEYMIAVLDRLTSVSKPPSYTISPTAQMAASRGYTAMASLSRARGTSGAGAAAMMCVSRLRM